MDTAAVEAIKNLTGLVAAHGIFALTTIFIFYQQHQSYKQLKGATSAADKQYFKKVFTGVLIVTTLLVVASSYVWYHATFEYKPLYIVRGDVMGLRTAADGAEGAASVSHQLAIERQDLSFYPVNEVPDYNGVYKFRWALVTNRNVDQLAFWFSQSAKIPAASLMGAVPVPGQPAPAPLPVRAALIEKRFVLTLDPHYSGEETIQIRYEPDKSDPLALGQLRLSMSDAKLVSIPWADPETATPPQPKALLGSFITTLLASQNEPSEFRADGTYDPAVLQALTRQLADPDLRMRLSARKRLVGAGGRSFRFINDVLDNIATLGGANRLELLSSLSQAIEEIEHSGTRFPAQGHVKLAAAFYGIGDYRVAVDHYERSGDELRSSTDVAQLAHAYLEIGSNERAARTFKDYIARSEAPAALVWANHGLALSYYRAGRLNDAAEQWQGALKLNPDYAPALNGVAYVNAKQGRNLPQALTMADRAIKLEPNDPSHQETRGYVLFKLGRLTEAHDIVKKVQAQLANDPDARRDLKEIEDAMAKTRKKASE